MAEIIVGIFAVMIGAMFGYAGNVVMRLMFPLIGFFVGFTSGAGLVAAGGDGFLTTVFGWVVGLFVGLLFGLLAYFFYEFAVCLAFAGLGFALTSGLLSLLNLDWNWLVVILGTLVGVAFGVAALLFSMPLMVLTVVSAFFGAGVFIYGLMLIFQTAELGDFSSGMAWESIRGSTGLYFLWLVLGTMGTFSQSKMLAKEAAFTKKYWEKSPGFDDYLKIK